MKPKQPKRLYFRKVKRRPARTWSNVRLHIGNTVHEVSGCIIVHTAAAFQRLASSMQRAAAGIAAAAQLLVQPRGYSFTGTLHLSDAEQRWLQGLTCEAIG
jgi:hypothetical protein